MQPLFECVEYFGAPANRFGQRRRADRNNHKFLKIYKIVSMFAAIDDIHHRHWQDMGGDAADVAVQWQPARRSCSLSYRQADTKNGIGAKPRLVFGAVQFNHYMIDVALVFGVDPKQGLGNFAVYAGDCLEHTFTEIALLVPVTQFDRFVRTG